MGAIDRILDKAWAKVNVAADKKAERSSEALKAESEAVTGLLAAKEAELRELDRSRSGPASTYAAAGQMAQSPKPTQGYAAASQIQPKDPLREALMADIRRLKGQQTDLANQYYNTENQEKRAALQVDSKAAGQRESIQTIEGDKKKLAAITAGYDGSEEGQRDRAYLMEKYGLTERELEGKAYELYRQLQTQEETEKAAFQETGYDYDRMKEYDQRQVDAQRAQQRHEGSVKAAREHPVLSSIATVGMAPFQGVDFLTAVLTGRGRAENVESYVPINTARMDITNRVGDVRGTVAHDIEENVGGLGGKALSFLYQTGMSVADSALQVGTMGSAATLFMGAGAASSQAKDIVDRGGSNQQAFWGGLAAGAAEAAFEKFSIDNLLSTKSVTGWKSWLTETAKQAGVEASEEMFTEVANILSDAAIMMDRSNWALTVNGYIIQGKSAEQAKQRAFLDCVGQVALAGLGGAISGGVMGGAVNAVNGINTARETGGRIIDDPLARAMFGQGETASTVGDEMRYSLKEFKDGKRFVDVEADQERFDGLGEKEMGYEARRVIKEKFKGKVIGLENKVFVNGNTAEEYGHPVKQLHGKTQEAKMRASTELDNLLDAGRNFRTKKDGADGHIHPEAVKDFQYFDTIFKVGGEFYSGIINIEPVAKGLLLKDITDIKNITQETRASYGENPQGRFLRDASMDSISQDREKDNTKLSAKGTEISEDVKGQLTQSGDSFIQAILNSLKGSTSDRKEDQPYQSNDTFVQAIVNVDRRSRFAQAEGTGSGLVYDDYVKMTLPTKTADRINALSKALGVRVRFVDSVGNGDANASISGSDILVEKGNKNPVLFLLGHEWLHRVQDLAPSEYRVFREAIADEISAKAEEVQFLYEQYGRSISYEQALNEATADYAGRMLEDGRLLDEFIERHRTDRTLLERFAEAIRELIGKLTGREKEQAQTVEKKLSAALDAAAAQAEALGGKESAATAGGETRYLIHQTVDGKKYVKADRQVIFGNDPDSWGVQIEDYINGKIRRGEDITLLTEDGDELKLTKDTAGKASFAYQPDGTRMSVEDYYLKVNAEAHIDELAKISRRGKKTVTDKDGRHGDFAKDGWNYRTAFFQDFDGKYYRLRISVAQGADGNIVYNIGDIKERSPLTVDGSSAGSGALSGEKASPTGSIS